MCQSVWTCIHVSRRAFYKLSRYLTTDKTNEITMNKTLSTTEVKIIRHSPHPRNTKAAGHTVVMSCQFCFILQTSYVHTSAHSFILQTSYVHTSAHSQFPSFKLAASVVTLMHWSVSIAHLTRSVHTLHAHRTPATSELSVCTQTVCLQVTDT
jgi:hypothetical protein